MGLPNRNEDKDVGTIVFVVILLLIGVISLSYIENSYEEYTYNLSEVENGTYAIVTSVSSRVPKNNYQQAIICCNGAVKTMRGNVSIQYSDSGKPKVTIRKRLVTNSDEVFLTVPEGTIKYISGISI